MRTWLMAGAAALVAPALAAQDFEWTGRLSAGKTVEVRGVNGDLRAEAAAGNAVLVTAVKRARRSDPADVKIEVVEHADGVTICAVYPTPRDARRENSCEPGGGHSSTRDNDVTVTFTVRLPAGVKFEGRTVNGEVEALGLRADAAVSTVNGSIEVSSTGLVEANTVNGSIRATMGRADWTGELNFHTVNGGITLTLPANVSTEIEAQMVNGDIESDFPLTVTGKFGPKRVRGTIGAGGRSLDLRTVNGSIRLRKAG